MQVQQRIIYIHCNIVSQPALLIDNALSTTIGQLIEHSTTDPDIDGSYPTAFQFHEKMVEK